MSEGKTEVEDPIVARNLTVDPGTREPVIEETHQSGFKDSFTRQQVLNELQRSTAKELQDSIKKTKK